MYFPKKSELISVLSKQIIETTFQIIFAPVGQNNSDKDPNEENLRNLHNLMLYVCVKKARRIYKAIISFVRFKE